MDVTIIVCNPRSGNSWLGSLLEMHPELHVRSHKERSTRWIYLLYPFRSFNVFGHDYAPPDTLDSRVFDGLRSRLLRRLYLRGEGKRKAVLVSATFSIYLPLLMRTFPEARFVHLVRPPLDVIASSDSYMRITGSRFHERTELSRMLHDLPLLLRRVPLLMQELRWLRIPFRGTLGIRPPGISEARHYEYYDFLTWYYVVLNKRVELDLTGIPDTRRRMLRYEHIISDFDIELARLLAFIGVDAPDDVLARMRETIRGGTVGSYRNKLPADTVARISRRLLGYGIDPEQWDELDDPAVAALFKRARI